MIRILALLIFFFFAAVPAAAQGPFASERISVEVRGSGPDVVLIPGLSSHPQVWESTIAALPGYRYHLVHVAGFAGKPAGANAEGPVLAPVAGEIARYIRESRLSRPAIVGHSMGGSWALMVAGRNPGLVSKVMVIDMMPYMAAIYGGASATPEAVRAMADQMRAGMLAAPSEGRRAQMERTIASMVRTEASRPRLVEQSLASDHAVTTQALYDLVVTDLRPDVAAIRVPMTVLWVRPPNAPITADQLTEYFRLSYAGAPQTVVRQIPDSYHFIMFDQPEVFQRELRTFLETR